MSRCGHFAHDGKLFYFELNNYNIKIVNVDTLETYTGTIPDRSDEFRYILQYKLDNYDTSCRNYQDNISFDFETFPVPSLTICVKIVSGNFVVYSNRRQIVLKKDVDLTSHYMSIHIADLCNQADKYIAQSARIEIELNQLKQYLNYEP